MLKEGADILLIAGGISLAILIFALVKLNQIAGHLKNLETMAKINFKRNHNKDFNPEDPES